MRILKKTLFISFSVLFLIIGLIGIHRASFRPDLPFNCENREDQVVVTHVFQEETAKILGVKEGDLLLRLDNNVVRNKQEIEFLLDDKKPGENVTLTIQRSESLLSKIITLSPKYGKRYIVFNLLLGFLFWVVGFFVFLKKPYKKAAQLFSYGSIAIAVAIMMVWPGHPGGKTLTGFLLPLLYHAVYPLVPPVFLHFFCIYPWEKRFIQKPEYISLLLYIPSIVFIILLEISYLPAIYFESLDYFRNYYHIYNAFRIFLIIYLILNIGCLIHSFRFARTKKGRQKVQWIIVGLSFGVAPFLFLWTFPQVLGFSSLIPEDMTYLFLMLIPLSIAFSIVKYQALDIDVIINRGIVYILVTGVIIAFYLIIVGLFGYLLHIINPKTSHILVIIFTLIAAILFAPIKQKIQTFVDKTFYRVRYSYRLAIKDFGNVMTTAIDRVKLKKLILEKITNAIPVDKIALLLSESSDNGIIRSEESIGITDDEISELELIINSELIKDLDSPQPMVKKGRVEFEHFNELPENETVNVIGIELVIPVLIQSRLKGILALGRKLSTGRYSEEDVVLLMTMAEEGIMALERLNLQESMIFERAEKDKLEELNRIKSEFISHVSHELRTPLTSIQWSVDNMLDGIPEKPSPKAIEYLKGISDSSQHLNRMIENLLDITKIEAGKIEISPEKINLNDEIKNVIEIMKAATSRKKNKLVFNEKQNLWITADRDRFKDILINIVDNAIKYSSDNSEVSIDCDIWENNTKMAVISIADQGIGIPKNKQRTIFQQFVRIKSDKTSKEKGMGLGLHIVRKLLKIQNGDIWVESEVGKGSIFRIALPRSDV